jgi:hypothetical protein
MLLQLMKGHKQTMSSLEVHDCSTQFFADFHKQNPLDALHHGTYRQTGVRPKSLSIQGSKAELRRDQRSQKINKTFFEVFMCFPRNTWADLIDRSGKRCANADQRIVASGYNSAIAAGHLPPHSPGYSKSKLFKK